MTERPAQTREAMHGFVGDSDRLTSVAVGAEPVRIAAAVAAPRTIDPAYPPLLDLVLRLGDDALVMSQRLVEWVANAPELEEDVALANIALDLLGQARMLLSYAGTLTDPPRSEDDLAYLRSGSEFRCCHLVQVPNGDFGRTMARMLVFSSYQQLVYAALRRSSDATIAAIAAKASKEVDYHVDHAIQWVLRLGDGTEESRRRVQAGLDATWPYVAELFDSDAGVPPYRGQPTDAILTPLVQQGVCPDLSTLRDEWTRRVTAVVEQATLAVPEPTWTARGGRHGQHTTDLDYVLGEMQGLHRAHPGATW